MTAARVYEPDEPVSSAAAPFISHSRLNRYLHCPEQYRLWYVENLRPRLPAAALVFGQAVHQALAGLFGNGEDPVRRYQGLWQSVRDLEVDYGAKESWERLKTTGEILLAKFTAEELPNLSQVSAVEQVFELKITNLDLPFVGVIDLVADFQGKRTVIDFKTSGTSYEEHEVILSDQLTAYKLAEPEARQVALCVLVKAKVPKIEWYLTQRAPQQLAEYLAKVGLIAREIIASRFYRRPGKWCTWCDFLPICAGRTGEAAKALVKIEIPNGHETLRSRQKEVSHAAK